MAMLQIEMDRGHGWEIRAARPPPVGATPEAVAADLGRYALQYRHPALVDGVVVAEVRRPGIRARASLLEA